MPPARRTLAALCAAPLAAAAAAAAQNPAPTPATRPPAPPAATSAAPNPFAPQPVAPNPFGQPTTAPYIRTTPPTDPVIRRLLDEETAHSEVAALAQTLADSVGPRLTGSPANLGASDWALAQYRRWGVPARREQYGTFNGWRRGPAHLDLLAPRVRTLEATMLAWSPGTGGGRPEDADVVLLPDVRDSAAFAAWLAAGNARGRAVLVSPPTLSCRPASQFQEFGTPAEQAAVRTRQDSVRTAWQPRLAAAAAVGTAGLGGAALQASLKAAGAVGVLTHTFSGYPGVDKVFGSPRQQLPTFDVGCEDYGLLVRLAEHGQGPRVRLTAESEFLGERPVFNTVAELRGREKPNEYVVLSAHFDSWDGGSGATDNGTGTVTMMEAMRLLKQALPHPRRTILVGHWSGEEQGLNGSRAFSEDHPEVVRGLQALFNQDNGTGRVVTMNAGGLAGAGAFLRRYLGEIPGEVTQYIRFDDRGSPASGGSDNASFACYGAPAFGLNSLSWDYFQTTWHTTRDTYDKLVLDDVRSNAMLAAMLAYQASEDPATIPRDRIDPLPNDPRTGQPQTWPVCTKALRRTTDYRR
ncbi:hypothetical protein tb265_10570 [Gemmatimonadetes bacterium T265]|nr:hypothetical protein tb265_10570 [Gemmatimonadetes bacterium T265]